jgi:hypothetical protein
MTNWKTTVASIIAAIGVGFTQSSDPTLKAIGTILTCLGTVLFGLVAKDFNVHGGTVAQGTPPLVQAESLSEGKQMEVKP